MSVLRRANALTKRPKSSSPIYSFSPKIPSHPYDLQFISHHHPPPIRLSSSSSSSSSSPQNTLPTFLHHATRSFLSPTSTVYQGTLYEYLCLSALSRFGFRLTRVGGRGDEGVDLIGTWHLPGHETPVKAIVQCKALKLKTGPALVRELEGALGSRGDGVAVLCARRPATKGVRDALRNSGRGLVWMQVERVRGEGEGVGVDGGEVGKVVVRQMLWNEAVERLGARGLDVTVKRTGDGEDGEGEIALLWEGEIWEPEFE